MLKTFQIAPLFQAGFDPQQLLIFPFLGMVTLLAWVTMKRTPKFEKGQTVMMAPGSGFYSDPADGRDEVRLAYVLKKEDLAKALVVLQKALEAYNELKQQ